MIYDIDGAVTLLLPGQFAGKTCGVCGNYNGNKNDDLTLGPACVDEGNIVSTIH